LRELLLDLVADEEVEELKRVQVNNEDVKISVGSLLFTAKIASLSLTFIAAGVKQARVELTMQLKRSKQ